MRIYVRCYTIDHAEELLSGELFGGTIYVTIATTMLARQVAFERTLPKERVEFVLGHALAAVRTMRL